MDDDHRFPPKFVDGPHRANWSVRPLRSKSNYCIRWPSGKWQRNVVYASKESYGRRTLESLGIFQLGLDSGTVNRDGSLSNVQPVESSVSGFRYSDALDEIEGILIEIIEPKLNKQGRKLNRAMEYFQVIDDKVKDISSSDILKEIKKLSLK